MIDYHVTQRSTVLAASCDGTSVQSDDVRRTKDEDAVSANEMITREGLGQSYTVSGTICLKA